jgi:polar amino acid transport system substrate-binding protein
MKRIGGAGWVSRLVAVGLIGLLYPGLAAAQAKPGLFQEIKARKKVVVATEAAYAPFEFIQEGKIVGYDKDLLDRVVQAWGVQLEQLDVPFAGILAGLLQKKYDFVCTALLINPERATKYAFTMPVAEAKVGIMKRKGDAKVKSVEDLAGLTTGSPVPPAGPTAVFAKYNDGLKGRNKASAKHVHFQSDPDMFLALTNGQIDAAVESLLVLAEAVKKQPNNFEIVGTFGEPFFIGWVTRPEDTDLRDALSVEIKKLRDSGEMAKLQQKWFGFAMTIPDKGYLPAGAR